MKTYKRVGDIITKDVSQSKSRKNLRGGTTTKTVKAKIVTDLANKKTDASGVKTKTVTNRGGTLTKTKTKALSPRKVLNRY